jgi:threonine dehydrogenase-like Zn-dependent dehydrogenase
LPDDVVVRTLYSAISRGTEAIIFNGRVPVSEYARMRAPFQAGDFPGPVKYGYASVGEIERGALKGRTVFVLYPHQTRYVVPAHSAYVVPPTIPVARAVLAANLETAINGLWDARPHIGDRVVVIGAGTVGCLTAWLAAKTAACDVELVDINPARVSVAHRLGVRFSTPEASDRRPDSADIAIHTSGSPDGLALALRLAAFEATIVEMSWYGSTPVPLALGEGFHSKRLTLKSSQVGVVAPTARARWNTRRRMELALALLADPKLDAVITGESLFEQLPETLARLAEAPGDTICHRIRYD